MIIRTVSGYLNIRPTAHCIILFSSQINDHLKKSKQLSESIYLKPCRVFTHWLNYSRAFEPRNNRRFGRIINRALTHQQIQEIQATAAKTNKKYDNNLSMTSLGAALYDWSFHYSVRDSLLVSMKTGHIQQASSLSITLSFPAIARNDDNLHMKWNLYLKNNNSLL